MGVIERDLDRRPFPASLGEEVQRIPRATITTEMILRVFLYGKPIIDYFPKSEEAFTYVPPNLMNGLAREIADRIDRKNFHGLDDFIRNRKDLIQGVTIAEFYVDRVRVNETPIVDIYRGEEREVYFRQLPVPNAALGILNEVDRAKREGWIVYNATKPATSF